MRTKIIILPLLLAPQLALASGWPKPEPSKEIPSGALPKIVPWSVVGAQGHTKITKQICQNTFVRCETVNTTSSTGAGDWGYRMYRRDNGAYLGIIDRNISEEIEADFRAAIDVAEEHKPHSKWVAAREADIARYEYALAACSAAGVYCSGMAARMEKFKELFNAACSAWSGACVVKIKEVQADLRKRIEYVEQQCAKDDQACFDAVTNGGEKLEAAKRSIEKEAGGARPPHSPVRPGTGRPPFLPGGDTSGWYDGTCEKCKIIEGQTAEEY